MLSSNKKVSIIIKNEVNCAIVGLHPDHIDFFYEEYGIKAENFFFSPKYKLGMWDGKIRYFHESGSTYVMLLDQIIPKIIKLGYKIAVHDNRVSFLYDVNAIDKDYFADRAWDEKRNAQWEIRPYQVIGINSLLEYGNGIVIAGTGAGKTIINAALVDVYGQQGARSITIVPNKDLIDQTVKWFKFFGLDTGEYSGITKDLNHQHIVSTWQALKNKPDLIRDFQVLVVDECHGAKAKVLSKLVNEHGQKIPYRFGLTGTLPKDKSQLMAIKVALGEVRFSIPAKELQDAGFLATLNISIMQLDDRSILKNLDVKDGQFTDFDMEFDWLQHNKDRLEWIAEYLNVASEKHKGNVLCLVGSVDFGKKLQRSIPGSHFIYGKDKRKVRQQVYDLFEQENNIIVIATVQIAGVGLSIDRIFNLVYIDGGKSFIRIIQAIGRGLRMGKDKDHVDVTDICSNLKYSRQHVTARTKYYQEQKYPHKKYTITY